MINIQMKAAHLYQGLCKALIPLISSSTSDERFVGHQLEIGLLWQPNRHIDARSYYVHFEPGKFVEDAGGKNVEFFLASVALRF